MPPRSRKALPGLAGLLALLAVVSLAVLSSAWPLAAQQPQKTAILQGLDKVTARVSTFDAPLDQPTRFGALEITVRACQKRPPEEPPESSAFLEISEHRLGEAPRRLFSGWMFASSPALNPLQHGVYDVWVLGCK